MTSVATKTTTRKTNREVRGICCVLRTPGTLPGQPDAAEIRINLTTYLCRRIEGGWELVKACDEKEAEPEVYHLTVDLTSCDCPDSVFRPRAGGCKHAKALKALQAAGKLPQAQ